MHKNQLNLEYKEIILSLIGYFCAVYLWNENLIIFIIYLYHTLKESSLLFFVQLDKSSSYLRKKTITDKFSL